MSMHLLDIEGSSQIAAIGYDATTRTLQVNFHSGGQYLYRDVPADVFHDFARAKKKGNFLHAEIKGRYAYERLESAAPPGEETAA